MSQIVIIDPTTGAPTVVTRSYALPLFDIGQLVRIKGGAIVRLEEVHFMASNVGNKVETEIFYSGQTGEVINQEDILGAIKEE